MSAMLAARTIACSRAASVGPVRQQLQPIVRRRLMSSETGSSPSGSQFAKEREAVKHHAAESSELWRKLSIYAVIPCLVLTSINAYNLWNEHWEHEAHAPPPSERPQYPYMNIRTKNFPFGDGDKTLFWNDKVNYHKVDEE